MGNTKSKRTKSNTQQQQQQQVDRSTLEPASGSNTQRNRFLSPRISQNPLLGKRTSTNKLRADSDERPLTVDKLREVFSKWAGMQAPHDRLSFSEFKLVCEEMQIALSDTELTRMFDLMLQEDTATEQQSRDLNRPVQGMTFDQFLTAVKQWRFLSTIVSSYSFASTFVIPADYNLTVSTNENYRDDTAEFLEPYKHLREKMDYASGYHVRYSEDRQRWQNEAIKAIVTRTEAQPRPWLVYTSGPPGVGKSYALSWMSEHGYFPLENIVRVDPDHFKRIMPEWHHYKQKDQQAAAVRCHRESGFLSEVAQLAAMDSSQNVWFDVTLKDPQWFSDKFDEFRRDYPQYRIAIFYITASDDIVRQRVAKRAEKEGRSVPSDVIEFALNGLPKSLEKLTPKVDFVARILNEIDGAAPVLEAVQVVDNSGSWNIIRSNFARTEPGPNEFPRSLAPVFLTKTMLTSDHLTFADNRESATFLSGNFKARRGAFSDSLFEISETTLCLKELNISDMRTRVSPRHVVNLDNEAKRLAGIPQEAYSFVWVNPLLTQSDNSKLRVVFSRKVNADVNDSTIQLLMYGGFAYFDQENYLICVNAVTGSNKRNMLQFGPPQQLPTTASKYLKSNDRWQPVTLKYLINAGATAFAWILPAERCPKESISKYGAFAYRFKDDSVTYFPVASSIW